MNPGEIALAEVQQADGKLKARPVVVLSVMPPFSDYLVCAVSSKLHHECIGFDEVIAIEDDDFAASGLRVASLVRLGMVATLPASPGGDPSRARPHAIFPAPSDPRCPASI